MTGNDYDEKRAFHRMQVNTKVNFTCDSSQQSPQVGYSKNLSATGLLMTSTFSPREGEALDINMDTENDRFPPFNASGHVVRVEPSPDNANEYLISLSIDLSR
ncbi:hypothetical protein LCGC14_2223020 [marine sediment metagenome]|uniref:PilZ domain-containing protein n=1 Tax=marine sediment metagenome TaxID=412755 RepID=A0A0F9G5W8_9ZZZZ